MIDFMLYIDPGTGYTLLGFLGWLSAAILAALGIMGVFFKQLWGHIKRGFAFLARHYKITLSVFILMAAGTIIGVWSVAAQQTLIGKRIIILGFDGISPDLAEPMMKAGELPNYQRLANMGSYFHLGTTNPPQSPVAWSGFATGKNGGKSGIFDFIHRDPKKYQPYLSLTKIANGKARPVLQTPKFWEYTSQRNINTIVLGCPVTFPAEKVYGKMLSGMGTPDILGTQSTYTYFTADDKDAAKNNPNFRSLSAEKIMVSYIEGPRVSSITGKSEKVKVPVQFSMEDGKVRVRFQQAEFTLAEEQWSDWQSVSFKINFFSTMKGIVKFYLRSLQPFKLYMTPVQHDPRDPAFPISYPASYGPELVEKFGLYYTLGLPMDTNAMNDGVLLEDAFIQQATEILHRNSDTLFYELERLQDGILYQYFESPDIIQHMFWRYTDPKHPLYEPDAPTKYKNTIREWYRKLDVILGKTIEALEPNDVLIMLSDHGFTTFRRAPHINAWLRQNGYLHLANGLEEGESLADVNWQKTRAYAVGFGGIYLNLQGREKQGIVKPGADAENLKREIVTKIGGWEDGNLSIVHKARVREAVFWGDQVGEAPDIYVGFIRGYRASWQTALGSTPSRLIEDNLKKWSGTHLVDPEVIPGVLYMNLMANPKTPTLYDLAPSILTLAGFSPPELEQMEFDGQTWFGNARP